VCGIAGIANSRLTDDGTRAALNCMSDALQHGGPDDSPACLYPAARAGLAFRRLALLDLITGNQPIANEDETTHLVANGEIYNHRKLRWELERTGYRFRTATDVEVIVHLYEEHGTAGNPRLNGMFELAILDSRANRLILARGSTGMEPLYYAFHRIRFPVRLRAGRAIRFESAGEGPDWDALDTYLAVGTPAPRTCFRGVGQLKAGHFLVVEENGAREETYWRLDYQKGRLRGEEREYAEELERLLRSAVRSHLDADVPGSGGWDPSLVGLMAAQISTQRLKTFSIVFPDHPAADESAYSRLLAERTATEHQEIEFRAGRPEHVARCRAPCGPTLPGVPVFVAAPAFLAGGLQRQSGGKDRMNNSRAMGGCNRAPTLRPVTAERPAAGKHRPAQEVRPGCAEEALSGGSTAPRGARSAARLQLPGWPPGPGEARSDGHLDEGQRCLHAPALGAALAANLVGSIFQELSAAGNKGCSDLRREFPAVSRETIHLSCRGLS
jgi:hypothetical protein